MENVSSAPAPSAYWCRACGQPQSRDSGACSECQIDLSVEAPPDSPIGLVHEIRGALGIGTKRGICVGVDGDTLILHFSANDKQPRHVSGSSEPTSLVPAGLCTATRFLLAASLSDPKLTWDRDLLRQRAADLCSDVRMVRRLVDDALTLGWGDVVAWAPLTPAEHAWRSAHHASSTGDLRSLAVSLTGLPDTGYQKRGLLLLPHLRAIREDPETWQSIVAGFDSQVVEKAELITTAAFGSWDECLLASSQLLPAGQAFWSSLAGQLDSGSGIGEPPRDGSPAWRAVSLLQGSDSSRSLDTELEHLAGLDTSLLDDVIDAGRLTSAAPLATIPHAARDYLVARVDPIRLGDEGLRSVAHAAELARRFFLRRDRASLLELPSTPRVTHYQALLELAVGGRVDAERLAPETGAILGASADALALLKESATSTLPDTVADDPSLWSLFSEFAANGKLQPDPSRRPDSPLNTWIGLQRLVGLLWEGSFQEAVAHGQALLPYLKQERSEDEALSLTAFALNQVGRIDEALDKLDQALRGSYTEHLLVNASVVAAGARPDVAVRYLARLVDEAPTAELKRAALGRAIAVWQDGDQPFPQVLIPALRTVMGSPLPLEEYLGFANVILRAAPDTVATLPDLGGELAAPHRLLQARARFKIERDYSLSDLAKEFIAVYRSVGRPEWFNDLWSGWVASVRESVFTDFGEAFGAALFIDTVLVQAPELFTQEERFVLAPQAGAHMNVVFNRDHSHLNESAWTKFFFAPIDEFLNIRNALTRDLAEFLASNFSLCVGNAGVLMFRVARDSAAEDYNQLVERVGWDTQNLLAIHVQMRRILEQAESGPLAILDRVVQRMRRLGSSDRDELTRLLAADVAEWHDEINRLRRNL